MGCTVLIGAAGICSVRFSRRLDPDISLELRKVRRSSQRRDAESGAALIAPLATMVAAVNSAGIYKCIYVSAGARCCRPIRAAPTVTRCVGDEIGAAHRPSVGAEEALQFTRVTGLIHGGVKGVEVRRDYLCPADRLSSADKRLFRWRVIRSVVNKTIDRT